VVLWSVIMNASCYPMPCASCPVPSDRLQLLAFPPGPCYEAKRKTDPPRVLGGLRGEPAGDHTPMWGAVICISREEDPAMERHPELIRALVQALESCPSAYGLEHMPEIVGYSRPEISYHLGLLREDGDITAEAVDLMGAPCTVFMAIKLTQKGHDLAQLLRDDTVWNKAKGAVLKSGVPWTIDLLLSTAKRFIGGLGP